VWRGDLRRWLAIDLGFLVFYLGLIGLLAGQPAGPIAVLGLLWYASAPSSSIVSSSARWLRLAICWRAACRSW